MVLVVVDMVLPQDNQVVLEIIHQLHLRKEILVDRVAEVLTTVVAAVVLVVLVLMETLLLLVMVVQAVQAYKF